MININRFLQKSYELQQRQYESEILSRQQLSQEAVNKSINQQPNQQLQCAGGGALQMPNSSQFESQKRMAQCFPLKINYLEQNEQPINDALQLSTYCSPQAQNSNQNMMASCAQFTFRNQTNSQNKVQNPSVQSPLPPTQSYSEISIQNNIIMNNLMTQGSLNFCKEKKQNQAAMSLQQASSQQQFTVQKQKNEVVEQDEHYSPISYNVSSNLKWDVTSKISQMQNSQSQYIVDESIFSKQQINTPLLHEIPHYPMMERASLEFNCNRLSEIPNPDYSPSRISDLSCLRIENTYNPQYSTNNFVGTQQWENNLISNNINTNNIITDNIIPNNNSNNNNYNNIMMSNNQISNSTITNNLISNNMTMDNSLNQALKLHLNFNQKHIIAEPNNRYDNIELSNRNDLGIFEQGRDNLTCHIVQNFESMESSISYNHSLSIVSDARHDNPQKNYSLKQEIENIINSTRENTHQLGQTTEFNSNQYPQQSKREELQPIKHDLPFFQQSSSVSSHLSSHSQAQQQSQEQIKIKHLPDITLNQNQMNDSDKENEENYNYEPKSNRNYQVSISTASQSEQYTNRQKQDTLRKLLSPESHQKLMSKFIGSSQTLHQYENSKQMDEFFMKSKQQLDSTRNNSKGLFNLLIKSREVSPLSLNSGGKKIGVNLSLTNLHQINQSTRNTQTKQINLNSTPLNLKQNSDRKQTIPKLSINISQMELKNSQNDMGKSFVSPNRLGQSQSTKNIHQNNRSSSNQRGGKNSLNERDELKQLNSCISTTTTKNKNISINLTQVNNHQQQGNSNQSLINCNPQLFKRLNNKSMTNVTLQTSIPTNQSISPSRKLQVSLNSNIQPISKYVKITPTSASLSISSNKQILSCKPVTPKSSSQSVQQNNGIQNSQNQAISPQRDSLQQYQLVYKPLNKQNNLNSAQMRRSNTQRHLLNSSSSNNNGALNSSKNTNNNNNNQSSFLNKSNELKKVVQTKIPFGVNPCTNPPLMDSKLDKFYKTNQKQIESITSKLDAVLSDRNKHKSINLNLSSNQSIHNNKSLNQIPYQYGDEINNNDQKIQEKLFETENQQLKNSGIQISVYDKSKLMAQNIPSTPNSQSQKQILQKCLHSLPQMYCNICNRKSRNNIQQLLSKR